MTDCLQIYQWHHAPTWLRVLSEHGGDEDWVFFLPAHVKSHGYLPMPIQDILDEAESDNYVMGFGHVDHHELPNGDIVIIFAHA